MAATHAAALSTSQVSRHIDRELALAELGWFSWATAGGGMLLMIAGIGGALKPGWRPMLGLVALAVALLGLLGAGHLDNRFCPGGGTGCDVRPHGRRVGPDPARPAPRTASRHPRRVRGQLLAAWRARVRGSANDGDIPLTRARRLRAAERGYVCLRLFLLSLIVALRSDQAGRVRGHDGRHRRAGRASRPCGITRPRAATRAAPNCAAWSPPQQSDWPCSCGRRRC